MANNTQSTTKFTSHPDVDQNVVLKDKNTTFVCMRRENSLLAEGLSEGYDQVSLGLLCLEREVETAVVLWSLQVHPPSTVALVAKTKGATVCDGWDGGKAYVPCSFLVFPDTRLEAKVDKPVAGTRVVEYDHLILGEVRGFWPPPVQMATADGRASRCWEVTAPTAGTDGKWEIEEGALAELKEQVGGIAVVVFRLRNKKGKPSKRWVVRIVWGPQGNGVVAPHLDFEATGGIKFEVRLRCALCSISPPWSSYHDHAQCPLLGTLNKVRENLRYEHIRVELNNKLVMPRTRAAIDIDTFVVDYQKWKAEVDRKLGKLAAAIKGGKKRKLADNAPGPSKPTKAPKKEKEDKDKGKGKQGEGLKDPKGKEKGKTTK
ncbi:hypothetical protein BC628DRAFT_1342022 [Trametes gibbosa]|nr:hypothetical protein BC628DRAFT_1342022 [Trametes gibbosa]